MARAPEPAWYRRASRSLLAGAAVSIGLAVVTTILAVLAFDYPLEDQLASTAIGVAIWGAVRFATEVRHETPGPSVIAVPVVRTTPPSSRTCGRVLSIVLGLAGCVVVTAWAVRLDMGGVFLPGQFLGYAAADLVGLAVTLRWERRNGDRAWLEISGSSRRVVRAEGPGC